MHIGKQHIKKLILLILVLPLLATYTKPYTEAFLECSTYHKMEQRNICRQNVTKRYRYIDDHTVEVEIFTLPKMQKNVVDFKEVFKDVED